MSLVFGQESKKRLLMSNLFSKTNSNQGEDEVEIISIVGARGIGKTTLALFAYNNPRVESYFDGKIWVSVSELFDEIKIENASLKVLNNSSPNPSQLQTLLQCIEKSVSGKRFLVVLDNVCSEKDTKWKLLKKSLKSGAPGCRILVTTKSEKIAEVMSSNCILPLSPLSNNDCWSILSHGAFGGRTPSEDAMLTDVGLKIADKCEGLPLAAKTMGNLLRFKTSLEEWENVLNSKVWELPTTSSFNELPFRRVRIHPSSNCDTKNLRSLFCENGISRDIFSHLQRVRLLSLSYCNLVDIPKEIGNLIHIRYLDLIGNIYLRELPETICELYNLQTLGIQYCGALCKLPEMIHKLINLRHLLNARTSYLFEFPQGFEKLTNLQTLDQYCVASYSKKQLGYLKELNQLEGSLCIQITDGCDEVDEAKKAGLKNKKFIRELKLSVWGAMRLEMVEALQPHQNLKCLDFEGLQLPEWISTLTNLTSLTIQCRYLASSISSRVPPLGNLPSLEYLHFHHTNMERLGHELLGISKTAPSLIIFPKLKTLTFNTCEYWEEWEDISEEEEEEEEETISIFPCLEQLHLEFCEELKTLPHRLLRKASSLKTLYIYECESLRRRYSPGAGGNWNKVSHIPSVEFKERISFYQ